MGAFWGIGLFEEATSSRRLRTSRTKRSALGYSGRPKSIGSDYAPDWSSVGSSLIFK